ncbi:hypothetical protein BJ508DRAFT_307509 [Ascobolus immersus RN42]|uniref:Uncharacterized protein n=1 Tax=Ascobolus immersus RN42 TaxID=1160509 RepID=A0A3N4I6J7_ASCIM|nr:hypothetical protein BJ508DRAFT_307509 [Ascobolus immersus RN42]
MEFVHQANVHNIIFKKLKLSSRFALAEMNKDEAWSRRVDYYHFCAMGILRHQLLKGYIEDFAPHTYWNFKRIFFFLSKDLVRCFRGILENLRYLEGIAYMNAGRPEGTRFLFWSKLWVGFFRPLLWDLLVYFDRLTRVPVLDSAPTIEELTRRMDRLSKIRSEITTLTKTAKVYTRRERRNAKETSSAPSEKPISSRNVVDTYYNSSPFL